MGFIECYLIPFILGLIPAIIGGLIGWHLRQDDFELLERNNKKLTKDYTSTKTNYTDLENQYSSYKLQTDGELSEYKLKNQSISAKLKNLSAGAAAGAAAIAFTDGNQSEVREVIKEVEVEKIVEVEVLLKK